MPAVRSVQNIGAELGLSRPEPINRLVGGTVDAPIRFDGAATAVPEAGGALPLYTRAADKIEATVAVNVGRAIDITG